MQNTMVRGIVAEKKRGRGKRRKLHQIQDEITCMKFHFYKLIKFYVGGLGPKNDRIAQYTPLENFILNLELERDRSFTHEHFKSTACCINKKMIIKTA